ncbi:MAG: hypothetical protein ACN6PL_19205, partial [Pseudomonas putida]
GQASSSAQGLQVAGASSAVSGGAQPAVPAAGVRRAPWANSRQPMAAGDVAILTKFNETTNTSILGLSVMRSREVRAFGINTLANGGDFQGTIRTVPFLDDEGVSFFLNIKESRIVWNTLTSALRRRKKTMTAIRQN